MRKCEGVSKQEDPTTGNSTFRKKKLSFDSSFVFTATGSDTTIEQGTSCEVKLTSELNKSLEIHTLDRLSKDIQH